MNSQDKKDIVAILKKYQKYIHNIQWHIKTNSPKGIELEKCEQRVDDYREIIADIKSLLPKPTPQP